MNSKRKGYPFEVPLAAGGSLVGVALADQIKSLDWRARLADFAGEAALATLHQVRKHIATLLQIA
ncbi:MAG: type II toxin-antitoxin system PemK/MazF family toxin [Vulcanimicrobiaceae bacterium]